VHRRGTALDLTDHESRSEHHRRVAAKLFSEREEWAAVAYFYASLHLVKAALLVDPIFDDRAALQAKHALLSARHRTCSRHRGTFTGGTKSCGLTDLVDLLYQQVSVHYEALFTASLDVRYNRGLRRPSLASLREDEVLIHAKYAAGRLVA
jgi:hypothetical protein